MRPNNIREMFLFRANKYDLRGFCKLDQPIYFNRFMHSSYQYVTTRLWNNLPDYVRRAPSLNIFKPMLDEVNLTTRVECDCNFCTWFDLSIACFLLVLLIPIYFLYMYHNFSYYFIIILFFYYYKKRLYTQRVMNVEQGTFAPLVFTTTGGMGEECKRYHNRLAELVVAKKGEDYANTVSWIRSKVSFAILRAALLCLRGSRTPKRTIRSNVQEADFELDRFLAKI